MSSNSESAQRRCSFCGKSQNEVRKLIANPDVCICEECVDICNEIIAQDEGDTSYVPRARRQVMHVGTLTCPKCRATFALHCETGDER